MSREMKDGEPEMTVLQGLKKKGEKSGTKNKSKQSFTKLKQEKVPSHY